MRKTNSSRSKPPKLEIAEGKQPSTAVGRSRETTSEGYPMTVPRKKTDGVKRMNRKMPKGSGY